MNRIIAFDSDARDEIFCGIDTLYQAVSCTLGPKGRYVVIKRPFKAPHATKDGVTVAKEIQLEEPFENVGVEMIREAASKTGDLAGDGTTTATILAREMIQSGLKAIDEENINPVHLRKGMNHALEYYKDQLLNHVTSLEDNPEMLKQVATISANNDEELGNFIAEAYKKVGPYGLVQMEKAPRSETYVEMINGVHFDRGFLSPYFANNSDNVVAEYEDVLILLYDGILKDAQEIIHLVQKAIEREMALLIIADEIKDGALKMLLINRYKQNIPVVAVKAPSFGDKRKDLMMDFAALTGGVYVSDATGSTLDSITLNDLGQADKIIVDANSTKILGCRGSEENIQDRFNRVKGAADSMENPTIKKQYEQRLATLSQGAAIIKVGATTETELLEKMDRVEDAIYAAKAALDEGVIVGGGSKLMELSLTADVDRMAADEGWDEDFQRGFEIVTDAIQQPMNVIMKNAGYEEIVGLGRVENNQGYNALTGQWENLFEAGVLDPVKVTRIALENAVSIASVVITTEVVIVPDPEDAPKDVTSDIGQMMF